MVLKVYEGFKFDEMAEVIGCPVSTVKSRLYTALELLKTELAPAGTRGTPRGTSNDSPDGSFKRLRVRRTGCRAARPNLEQHLTACDECAFELERLRVTTSALRILPDVEIPQRIAFVSDKVFEPSPASRFFARWWNPASACILAAAVIFAAYHRPAEVRTVIQTASSNANNVDVSKQVNDVVNDAVAKAVAQVQRARGRPSAIEATSLKYEHEYQSRMAAVEESYLRCCSAGSVPIGAGLERPAWRRRWT